MNLLDTDLARHFAELGAQFAPLPADPTPLERRARYWALVGLGRTALPQSVTMNDVAIDAGGTRLGVRLFWGHDERDEPVPLIIYFHGGGWVVGDTDTHTVTCARMAHEANALVASIDYPLAPETDWRTMTTACFDAAAIVANDRLRHDNRTPVALAGDSAGAHLAAVTAIRVRDEARFALTLQALIYPTIEPDFTTPSYGEFGHGPGLTRADMQWYWRHYAGADVGLADYRIAPTRASSLSALAPTYLVTAGCDPLRDEGRAWADALRGASNSVTHDEFATLPHGFLRMAKYSAAVDHAISAIHRRLGQLLRQAPT